MEDGVSKYTPKTAWWCILVAAFCWNARLPQVHGLEESTGPGGSNTKAVHNIGETGEGVNIGVVLAMNVLTTHEAFADENGVPHAFNYDFSGDGILVSSHDTQLTGIIASRGGDAYPNDIGVAPGADIHCARVVDNNDSINWYDLRDALDELVTNKSCRVIVSGFALVGLAADGQSEWTKLYDYYAYDYDVVFANAAGNQNTAILMFGDAYNGITTGGLRLNDSNNEFEYRRVGSISGSGPTDDGRRKPEVTAPAQSQTVPTSSGNMVWATVGTTLGETSYSVPQTAGAAALLLGLADETLEPNDNHSEVIKAALVNAAMPNVNNKADVSTNPADSNNTWNADRGYGRLDVLRAYQTLDTSEVEPDVNVIQGKGWAFGHLAQGQTNVYTISVAERCRLIATLIWQRRMQWTDDKPHNGSIDPGELIPHLADLDMIVYGPDEPNAIFSEDSFGLNPNDNLEKCDLLITKPGDYTVVIENDSATSETADYGFAFELHPLLVADLPPYNYAVDYSDLSTLTIDWLSEDSELDLLLKADGVIDFADFAQLADSWLQVDPLYYQGP
jgi:hypothetical protein